MKRKKAVLAALIASGLLTGCLGRGGSSALNESGDRIYVTKDGVFQTAMVDTYEDRDYYRVEDLKAYLEKAAADYSAAHGQGAVALDSCTMENGLARAVFTYSSGEALSGFASEYGDNANEVESITIAALSEVLGQSESEGVTLLDISDGKKAEDKALERKGNSSAVVVVTENSVTLQTEKKLLFVSDNVTVKDSHTALLTEGKSYIIFK